MAKKLIPITGWTNEGNEDSISNDRTNERTIYAIYEAHE